MCFYSIHTIESYHYSMKCVQPTSFKRLNEEVTK